jgi:3-hydroxyisobutyrate dehydrogenase-like beta-hydroxyacid dehydrogenase
LRVGLLHPGAMGAFLGSGIAAAGHEVLWAGEGRSAATRARAADFTDVGSLGALVRAAPVIISVCPPEHAREVAQAVADAGFRGLFVDANAVSARTVQAIDEVLPSVVDGAVIGGPSTEDAMLHLAGERAIDAAALFDPAVVRTQLHDGPVGTASTVKACYAASSKAATALLLAARAAARAAGVEEILVEEWARTMPEVLERSDRSLSQIGAKAWRFGAEMIEAADVFDSLGVPSGFSRAAAEVYARLADLRDVPYTPADVLARVAQ